MSNGKVLYPPGVTKRISGKIKITADEVFKTVTSVSKRPKKPSPKPSKKKPKWT